MHDIVKDEPKAPEPARGGITRLCNLVHIRTYLVHELDSVNPLELLVRQHGRALKLALRVLEGLDHHTDEDVGRKELPRAK